MPTASAVVADLIDTAVGRAQITFESLGLWSQRESRVPICKPTDLIGRYYLHFNVADHPGVLADITGALGRHNISIASVIQHETPDDIDGHVPLVIMTHAATEGAAATAVREIDQMKVVRQGSVRMRVLDSRERPGLA